MKETTNEPTSTIPTTTRHDGWTGDKMATFLETLADTGIVLEACDAAHMGTSSAYALRRRNAAFAAGWDGALTIAREKLADTLLARAIEGNSELILRDGVIVGERQVIDNKLGLAILRRLDRLAETGCAVSAVGQRSPQPVRPERSRGAPAPCKKPFDWELALNAIRTGEADDLAEALAMFKACEVDEVDTPPNPLAGCPEQEDDADLPDRCWWDEEEKAWMTDFPPPDGFAGEQVGTWNDVEYRRGCSPEEVAILEANEAAIHAQELAEDAARRDSWLASIKAGLETRTA